MLTVFDYVVLIAYLVGVAAFGIVAGGRQRTSEDYFLGGRSLPWWAVCFSVVATETSTLTVIGVPAVAFGGSLTFLQITVGFLIGRVVVAVYLLPRYYAGDLQTAYAFLEDRFGGRMRTSASLTFLVTRLLADGVRLFATAIPLKIIADSAGLEVSYFAIIAGLAAITVAYTLVGGIKAVVWMDVVQMLLYVGGAVLAIVLLLGEVPTGWWAEASAAGKTQLFRTGLDAGSLGDWLTTPYAAVTAVVGGAFFSMASHGTDQLIVQRLLTCRDLADSRKALVGSGFLVVLQFALFLFVGLLLWSFYGGVPLADLGLQRGDEVFPQFIIQEMPQGVSGLLLAGIVAAAMSTLSSSLNALASSTVFDLYERLRGEALPEERQVPVSRILTLVWGVVFVGFASAFQSNENPVVELGLGIAGYTYGGLLGAFGLGLLVRRARESDALVAFFVTIGTMALVILGLRWSPEVGWLFALWEQPEGARALDWPWYTVLGTLLSLAIGSLLALRHRQPDAPASLSDPSQGAAARL